MEEICVLGRLLLKIDFTTAGEMREQSVCYKGLCQGLVTEMLVSETGEELSSWSIPGVA